MLEGRAGLAAVGRLATDPDVIDQRALVISDSQVVIGAMSKGRSSIPIVNYLARRVAALRLALGMRLSWRYVRTHRNHADAPSRGRPFGVLPAAEKTEARAPPGARLPDFFYRLTRG